MKKSGKKFTLFLIAALFALSLFTAPIKAQEVSFDDHLASVEFIGPEFVLLAYSQLEDNYYKPEILNKAKLLNAALGGISKLLKKNGVDFVPNAIDETLDPSAATDKFINEYERAAQLASDINSMEATDLAFVATRFMLRALESSHVYFMSPEQMEERRKMLSGEALFSGIGVVIAVLGADKRADEFEEEKDNKDGFIYIAKVYPGAPADKAGVKKFDRIVEINGEPISGTTKELASKVRGPKGTPVKITVERAGERKVIEIIRDDISAPVPEVSFYSKNDKRIMQLVIHSFEPSALYYTRKILLENKFDGLIIDLRSNPGGYVEVLGSIASYFLKPGTVLFTSISRGESPRDYRTKKLSFSVKAPLVVMIDGYSASASEIMAAAMKDHNRAKVVGDKSAGAVEVGTTLSLTHGAGMVVAISDVLAPKGERIENVGVTPHVMFKMEDEHIKAGKDIQLDIAIDVLLEEIKK